MQFAYNVGYVWESITKLKHKNDGLIFTAINASYVLGTCEKMYTEGLIPGLNGSHQMKTQWISG